MDTVQWPQIVVKPIEEIVTNTCPKPQGNNSLERKAARPQKEQSPNCPRCNSTNTKFCYYNNYSLTQPRYFCKTCRRYWTKGGSLRNIPVGGGSRKNKRSSSSSISTNPNSSHNNINSSSSSSASKKLSLDDHHHQNPRIPDGQDLNLAFPSTQQGIRSFNEMIQVPSILNKNQQNQISSPSASTSPSHHLSALELLTGISSRGLTTGFMPMPVHHQDPNTGYGQGFPLHDFKPTLSFSLDGLGSGYGSLQESANGRLLFPFEDIKQQQQQQVSNTGDDDDNNNNNNLEQHHKDSNGDSTGYWTGMLGGGSW